MSMRYNRRGDFSSYEAEKLQKVLNRKRVNGEIEKIRAKLSFMIGTVLIVVLDMYLGDPKRSFLTGSWIVWLIEFAVTIVLGSVTLWELAAYFRSVLFPSIMELTSKERELFGITEHEPGFKGVAGKTPEVVKQPVLKFSPSCYTPNRHHSSYSPLQLSCQSAGGSPTNKADGSLHSSFMSAGNASQHSRSFNNSFDLPNASWDGSFVTLQRKSPAVKRTSAGKQGSFNTEEELDQYLTEQNNKEKAEYIQSQADLNTSLGSSFWSINRTVADYIPLLKKFQYQVAPRSSETNLSLNFEDSSQPAKHASVQIWNKMGVSISTLDLWIENLRYYMGQTIVQRLASEIAHVNKELKSHGSEDSMIGESSVSSLKNLSFVKSSLLPTLTNIIPYLEITSHQEYLVHRIKTLGQDGCLADFNWDGGSSYNGKPWEDYLPTDSAIVMHLFATYLDARLPGNPKYPNGKAFTSQHLILSPDTPDVASKSDYFAIYQSKVNPPHFKVVIGDEIVDLPKGRTNLFEAILLFLLHIRDKRDGMLGQVSFGAAGVNMLWILSQKYR